MDDPGARSVSRRTVLLGLGTAPLAAWALAGCVAQNDEPTAAHPALVPPKSHALVALAGLGPVDAAGTLRTLAGRARELNQAKDVNVTIALGRSAFNTLGASLRCPSGLTTMPTFPGDLLAPPQTNTDLLFQVESATAAQAEATLRTLTDGLSGLFVSWVVAGRRPENRVDQGRALTRNPFGFTEGLANAAPAAGSTDDVSLIRSGEAPDWAVGGSYLAARVIQLAQELWDKDSVETQEQIIGRRRDGAWLDGTAASGEPDFAGDPEGTVTPLDAHVRRAHPRDGRPGPPLLRRSWTYAGDLAADQNDAGILFMCYQRNLKDGFEAVQHRLDGQALDLYLLTVGGGYFLVPPAGQPHWEDGLLAPPTADDQVVPGRSETPNGATG